MYLGYHAKKTPHHTALIDARTGKKLTFAELDARSNRAAHLLRRLGLSAGDQLAVLLPNIPEYLEVAWAALRSGLYLTPLNTYMTADEIAHIVNDSGAKALISSLAFADLLEALDVRMPRCDVRLLVDGTREGWEDYARLASRESAIMLEDETVGAIHCYSSGTTGRPKGVKLARLAGPITEGVQRDARSYAGAYHLTPQTIYMTPAPLFHSAALHFSIAVHGQGGTVVLMDRFDALRTLQLMERFRVTHTQWVPTMFARLLRLPKAQRESFDLSHHQLALHSAAPCRVELKRQMIDWWGPILWEAYGCTELYGFTAIDTEDWLRHPGSVGQPKLGKLHICDEAGQELPTRSRGLIYFEGPQASAFHYSNDAEKTRSSRHPRHPDWSTVGDIGYVDEEGYLYLTDRKDFMIISGGINISPQAVEDALSSHPRVEDVAVIGVPDADLGEQVKAVVQLLEGTEASAALADELIAHARRRVARHMAPRSIDFVRTLPRLPNGKLYKRALRDRYWSQL
jgi:long-chain acyl-CoA synthetase